MTEPNAESNSSSTILNVSGEENQNLMAGSIEDASSSLVIENALGEENLSPVITSEAEASPSLAPVPSGEASSSIPVRALSEESSPVVTDQQVLPNQLLVSAANGEASSSSHPTNTSVKQNQQIKVQRRAGGGSLVTALDLFSKRKLQQEAFNQQVLSSKVLMKMSLEELLVHTFKNSETPLLCYEIATRYEEINDTENAVDWYGKTIATRTTLKTLAKTGNDHAQFILGQIYFQTLAKKPENFRLASKWYEAAAQQGHPLAQYKLGMLLYEGQDGISLPNHEAAASWFEKAASQDNPDALYYLGLLHYAGQGGYAQDYAAAADKFEKAAKLGHADAQYYLGVAYLKINRGREQNEMTGLRWLRKAAAQNQVLAQFSLAQLYLEGQSSLPQDADKAYDWFQKAAEQKFGQAFYYLGLMNKDALGGCSKNYEAAAHYFRKATKQGCAEADYQLGLMHLEGLGNFTRNAVQAKEYFEKASGQNYFPAQYQLGLLYLEDHEGLEKDEEKARQLIEEVANQNYAPAQFWLGEYYEQQPGKFFSALQWLTDAAKNGHIPAQLKLQTLYTEGRPGLPADPETAQLWAQKIQEQQTRSLKSKNYKALNQLKKQVWQEAINHAKAIKDAKTIKDVEAANAVSVIQTFKSISSQIKDLENLTTFLYSEYDPNTVKYIQEQRNKSLQALKVSNKVRIFYYQLFRKLFTVLSAYHAIAAYVNQDGSPLIKQKTDFLSSFLNPIVKIIKQDSEWSNINEQEIEEYQITQDHLMLFLIVEYAALQLAAGYKTILRTRSPEDINLITEDIIQKILKYLEKVAVALAAQTYIISETLSSPQESFLNEVGRALLIGEAPTQGAPTQGHGFHAFLETAKQMFPEAVSVEVAKANYGVSPSKLRVSIKDYPVPLPIKYIYHVSINQEETHHLLSPLHQANPSISKALRSFQRRPFFPSDTEQSLEPYGWIKEKTLTSQLTPQSSKSSRAPSEAGSLFETPLLTRPSSRAPSEAGSLVETPVLTQSSSTVSLKFSLDPDSEQLNTGLEKQIRELNSNAEKNLELFTQVFALCVKREEPSPSPAASSSRASSKGKEPASNVITSMSKTLASSGARSESRHKANADSTSQGSKKSRAPSRQGSESSLILPNEESSQSLEQQLLRQADKNTTTLTRRLQRFIPILQKSVASSSAPSPAPSPASSPTKSATSEARSEPREKKYRSMKKGPTG